MKNRIKDHTIFLIGLVLLASGLFLVKTIDNPQGIMRACPYVCIGIGSGLFGQGMSNIISAYVLKDAIDLKKQLEIEKHDERNIILANKAKGKAFDVMTFVFSALMLSFALMGIDMTAVLLLVFAYLFVQASAIYYRLKYEKMM